MRSNRDASDRTSTPSLSVQEVIFKWVAHLTRKAGKGIVMLKVHALLHVWGHILYFLIIWLIYESSPDVNIKSLLEWGMISFHCPYMQIVLDIRALLVNTVLPVHIAWHRNLGVSTALYSTHCENWKCLFPCALKGYHLFIHIMPYCTLQSCCTRHSTDPDWFFVMHDIHSVLRILHSVLCLFLHLLKICWWCCFRSSMLIVLPSSNNIFYCKNHIWNVNMPLHTSTAMQVW
jgi:hypothetical protein